MKPAPPVTHTVRELMEEPLSGGALAALAPLEREFYQRATATVARDLLGKLVIRDLPEGRVAVRLAEVEAYLGIRDAAAHTFGSRRTPRNEVMWGDGGHLYVYFTYGMHFCANVACEGDGVAAGVLLRALEPDQGVEARASDCRELRGRGEASSARAGRPDAARSTDPPRPRG